MTDQKARRDSENKELLPGFPMHRVIPHSKAGIEVPRVFPPNVLRKLTPRIKTDLVQ